MTIGVNNGIMLDRAEVCTSLCVVVAILAATTHKLVNTSAPSISHAGTIQTSTICIPVSVTGSNIDTEFGHLHPSQYGEHAIFTPVTSMPTHIFNQ